MSTATTDVMTTIANLLAKAQNTDNEHEKAAFMAAAQAKATRNQIDLAHAQALIGKREAREQPIRKVVPMTGKEYWEREARQVLVGYLGLFGAIARANDVRHDVRSDATAAIAYGFPSDIELCETLFVFLLGQMVAACEEHLKSGDREMVELRDEYGWRTGKFRKMDARVVRRSFMQGFANTVGMRLREARDAAIAEAEAEDIDSARYDAGGSVQAPKAGSEVTRTALVLRDKAKDVNDFYKTASNARGTFRSGATSRGSYGAANAGRSAGQRANIAAHTAIGA